MPSERSFDFRARSGHCFRVRALTERQLQDGLEAHGWVPALPLAGALWAVGDQSYVAYADKGEGQEVKA